MELLKYERKLLQEGITLIAGIDEAGRGPLAGPVTVCAVIMDLSEIIPEVNDSKKLSEKKRELLFDRITERAITSSVIHIEHNEIDEINILNATKKGMKEAAWKLFPLPEYLLVDAVKYEFGIPSKSIVHGDALSYSIAAASILAKVSRDRLMADYANRYPQYGFEQHKGYGTRHHIEMIKKYGPCPIHRKTFIEKFWEGRWTDTEQD